MQIKNKFRFQPNYQSDEDVLNSLGIVWHMYVQRTKLDKEMDYPERDLGSNPDNRTEVN